MTPWFTLNPVDRQRQSSLPINSDISFKFNIIEQKKKNQNNHNNPSQETTDNNIKNRISVFDALDEPWIKATNLIYQENNLYELSIFILPSELMSLFLSVFSIHIIFNLSLSAILLITNLKNV